MIAPGYLTYYAVLGSIGIIAAVLLAMSRALAGASWPARDRRTVVRAAAAALAVWFVAALLLAWSGAFVGTADGVPTIQFGVLVPILIGVAAYWRYPAMARLLDAMPQQWLIGVQLYRVLGAVFVVLFAAGSLPGLFALPAGLGDLAVGLLAPIVALAYARNPSGGAASARAWNYLGLADLAAALAFGFATSPSPVQLAAFDSPNALITAFPLVLIPAFLVPLSILLHMASLAKLRRMHSGGRHALADLAR